MRKLSSWARENKQTARFTIIICYLLLNLTGLFLGDIIHSLNIELTPLIFFATIALTISGWMIYPSKNNKHQYRNFFARQKSADIILVSATFFFIVFIGNSMNNNWKTFSNNLQAASVINSNITTSISEPSATKTTVSKKSLRKKLRAEFKNLRKAYKESSNSQKTLYIILAVIAAVGLTYVLGAAACGITCSGSEALAIVIFALGFGGIIFGLVKLIQRITRGKPNK